MITGHTLVPAKSPAEQQAISIFRRVRAMIDPPSKQSAPVGPNEQVGKILQLINETIDGVNQQLAPSLRLAKSEGTVLMGDQGVLDSLGLINFLVTLEETCAERLGRSVKLLDEKLLADPSGPLHTVGSLAEYIAGQH